MHDQSERVEERETGNRLSMCSAQFYLCPPTERFLEGVYQHGCARAASSAKPLDDRTMQVSGGQQSSPPPLQALKQLMFLADINDRKKRIFHAGQRILHAEVMSPCGLPKIPAGETRVDAVPWGVRERA